MESERTSRLGKEGRDHYLDILANVIQPSELMPKASNLYEYQACLDDQYVIEQICSHKPESARFSYGKHTMLKTDSVWKGKPGVTFRSESVGIVFSDIIPVGQDCILLELSNDTGRSNLRLEPGTKNKKQIDISLYKESGLIEKLKLRKRISWDLDGFDPGDYRLILGKQKSFQFVIQE